MKTSIWLRAILAFSIAQATPVALAQCVGDADGDGDTDVSDLSIVCSNFAVGGPCGDLNGDGVVDLGDFAIVIADIGCPGGALGCNSASLNQIAFSVREINTPPFVPDPQYPTFFGAGCTHYTFDLLVTVPGGPIQWFGSFANAQLLPAGALFFQHPAGNPTGGPPAPGACPPCGSLPFDSYWATAAGGNPTIAAAVQTAQQLSALWFDCPPTPLPAGTYQVARYTIAAPCGIRPKVVPAGTSVWPVIGGIRGNGVTAGTPGVGCAPDCAPIAFDIVNCAIPGDVDRNCQVDLIDLSLLLASFGLMCP